LRPNLGKSQREYVKQRAEQIRSSPSFIPNDAYPQSSWKLVAWWNTCFGTASFPSAETVRKEIDRQHPKYFDFLGYSIDHLPKQYEQQAGIPTCYDEELKNAEMRLGLEDEQRQTIDELGKLEIWEIKKKQLSEIRFGDLETYNPDAEADARRYESEEQLFFRNRSCKTIQLDKNTVSDTFSCRCPSRQSVTL
jgi:hypothetical protein